MTHQFDQRTQEEIDAVKAWMDWMDWTAREVQRRKVQSAVGGVLFNVSNFPQEAQSRLLGRDMAPLRDKITDAALDALGIKVLA